MTTRFKVTRSWIKHKGVLYRAGELLPVEFTLRDKIRNLYPSRIGVVEVPTPACATNTPPATPVTIAPVSTAPTSLESLESSAQSNVIAPSDVIKEVPEEVKPPIVPSRGTNSRTAKALSTAPTGAPVSRKAK